VLPHAPLLPAEPVVVFERVCAARLHVRVGREIARDVEERVRVAAFLPANGIKVLQRIDMRRRHVGIVREIVDVSKPLDVASVRSSVG